MLSLGIAPGDGLKILEYHESSWFIRELAKLRKREKVNSLLDQAEAFRMAYVGANKDGFKHYDRWLRNLKNTIEDQQETGEGTLFDQLKKRPEPKKRRTLFESLKK